MAGPLQRGRLTLLTLARNGNSLHIEPDFSQHVESIIGPDETEEGSFTGRLEKINIHAGERTFTLYPTGRGFKVNCLFSADMKARAIAALDHYVTVYGLARYKHRDAHPYALNVRDIEVHPPAEDLPRFDDLRGIARGAFGEGPTEEFVRRDRDEWRGGYDQD